MPQMRQQQVNPLTDVDTTHLPYARQQAEDVSPHSARVDDVKS
jgi:hypothetical protein